MEGRKIIEIPKRSGSTVHWDIGPESRHDAQVNDALNADPLMNSEQKVICQVCHEPIDGACKRMQDIIKCNHCHEATPLRKAPPGKKYVRCPCNCLLVCSNNSTRVTCPRPNCRRTINLSTGKASQPMCAAPELNRASCGNCFDTFEYNPKNSPLVQCPHCSKVSCIGKGYALKRAVFFTCIGILMLLLLLLFLPMNMQFAKCPEGGISGKGKASATSLFCIILLVATLCFCRALHYCCMTQSTKYDDCPP